MPNNKTIRVVAAIIMQNNKVFAAKRDYGELKGYWEFPGGKIKNGESPREALKREIEEELHTKIEVGEFFMNEQYDYPTFHLDMDVFFCEVLEGTLNPEKGIHGDSEFIDKAFLLNEKWCPADMEIATKLYDRLQNRS
ncbi:MAG: (deoxy)nucleoside triphosphate pyrophosphohydrolase [Erysipelotrichaceae bacterium]|nr:(deoxy)nucleoside triphosphate pyrophosphohydrolase [Erysipelotrichaceae bacterium]